jgi:maleate cis-trans isomerase
MNEDILDAAISVLKAKVDVIMYDVNSILSSGPTFENEAAKKLASKISDLAMANQNYQQALSLKMQMLSMKVQNLPQNDEQQNNQADGDTA